jgi:adiponectin receptor
MQQPPILSDFHHSDRPRDHKSSRRRNVKKKENKNPSPSRQRRRSSTTQLVKDAATSIRLYAYHELESWQQDNEFLHSGYRAATNSYRQSLSSLSYIHNQSGNIYSHVIGAFLFICFGFFVYYELVPRYGTADAADLGIFAIFGMGAMGCFGVSAGFHTVGNHSEGVYYSWLLWDLYGVLGLICGTVYSGVFYGFYCERNIWIGYSVEVGHVFPLC